MFQIPACLPKITLNFTLTLKKDPKIIYIEFNYAITYFIPQLYDLLTFQIQSTQLSSDFYNLTTISDSTVEFKYIANQYIPPLALLTATFQVDEAFNNDPYQMFMVGESQTIQMKEIYPFSETETAVIVVMVGLVFAAVLSNASIVVSTK
mgnify:CR=1 FL=1